MIDRDLRDLTLVFVTMARPACAKRLIETVRQFYPRLKIVMVEQVDGPSELSEIAATADVRRVVLPFDAGISVARNAAISAVSTEYFILADDDFVFLEDTDFGRSLRFMAAHPEVAFLGGNLEERGPGRRGSFPKARNLLIDRTGRGILVLPAEMLKTNSKAFEDERFQFCDLVSDWGVGRTARFKETPLLWDERFKTGGAHYDFYLTLKQHHPHLKIAHTSTLLCAHEPIRDPEYIVYRSREDWTRMFSAKWDVDYLYVVGGNIRWFSNITQAERPYQDSAWRTRFEKLAANHERIRQQLQSARKRVDDLKSLNAKLVEEVKLTRNRLQQPGKAKEAEHT